MTTPKLATTLEHPIEMAPPDIPNWDRSAESISWPESRWEHATKTRLPQDPVRPGPVSDPRRLRQGRAFTAAIAVGFLVLVFVAGAVVLASLHHSPKAPTGPAAALTSSASASASDVAQLLAATKAADAANTSAQAKLHPLPGFPTPAKVSKVINPYVRALQRYKTALADIPVPASARTLSVSAHALVTRDLHVLGTINGLPPVRLGSYLEDFSKGADKLHTTLGSLQRELKAPSF
jgi:hypothetical protein